MPPSIFVISVWVATWGVWCNKLRSTITELGKGEGRNLNSPLIKTIKVMNTFYDNLIAAGAKHHSCPNGEAVELLGSFWVFTDTQSPISLYGDGNGGYVSVPKTEKRPVVLVENESMVWGHHWTVQDKVPLDGRRYKVYC